MGSFIKTVEIHRSYVNKILQPRLRLDPLSTPVHAKWVCPFLLPWFDSIARVQPGLLSLSFHWLKYQMVKNVSFGCYSSYCSCIYWQFTTKPGALPFVHTFRNPHQRCKVWCQLWLWPINTINFGSSRLPVFLCTFHFPDVFPSLIWYGPDELGARSIMMHGVNPVGLYKEFCHIFHCDVWWAGCLFRS